jgi:hypothetical protein
MSAYRDTASPTTTHVVVLDRVRLEFGAGGLLVNATAEQVETMTATALRRARFVQVEQPRPVASRVAKPEKPATPEKMDAPAKTEAPAKVVPPSAARTEESSS